MSDVVYLYGFVRAGSPPPPATLRGLADRPVELLATDGLEAVISHLPEAEYGGEGINAHLEDLGWLAERGVAHERVVAWLVDQGDVLPAGLFTLYSSTASLAQDAARRADELHGQLERLQGSREWDLKVSFDRDQLAQHAGAVSPEVRELDEEVASAPPGRRFLLERKRADLLRRELGSAARQAGRELLARLRPHAREVAILPAPRDTLELPVVLAAALLVERVGEAALRHAAADESAALVPLGFTVELTGPWAPYRFLEARDVDVA